MKKARIVLVAGFLGSGKTSFLRHWLDHLKPPADHAALVVNEIGKANVDAAVLGGGLDALKLLSGCLCCSGKEELLAGLRRLLESPAHGRFPDWVLVECSGLADPSEVFDSLLHPKVSALAELAAAVTVVDASRYTELALTRPLVVRQAAYAGLLIANKADLMPETKRPSLEAALKSANPRAAVAWCVEGKLDRDRWQAELGQPLIVQTGMHRHHQGGVSYAGYYAWEWAAPGPLQRAGLEKFLGALPESVDRVKGLVELEPGSWVLVQVTGGQVRLHPWKEEPTLKPGLTFIGRGVDGEKLARELENCVR